MTISELPGQYSLASNDRRPADAPGFKFLITWKEVGKARPSDAEIVEAFRSIPRDGAVFALSRVAQTLVVRGEADPAVQAELVYAFLKKGNLRLRNLRCCRRGYLFACRASIVSLTRLAIENCASGSRVLDEDQRDALFRLLLCINEHLSGRPSEMSPADRPANHHLALLAAFLAVNNGASGNPEVDMLIAWGFGAMCARAASQRTESRKVDSRIVAATGRSIRELHTMTKVLLGAFQMPTEGWQTYKDVRPLPIPAKKSCLDPIDLCGLVEAFCTEQLSPKPVSMDRAAVPLSAWPEPLNWRPMFQSAGWVVCWDVHLLRRMVSFNFPEVVRLLAPSEHATFETLWNRGVEDALAEAFRLYLPEEAVQRITPGVIPSIPKGEKPKLADWLIEAGDDLFIVEWKNLRLPPSTFGQAEAERFGIWINSRFARDEGFLQLYSTIAYARHGWHGPPHRGTDSFGRFKRIWPIVLIPFQVSFDVVFEGHLVAACCQLAGSLVGVLPGLRGPLVMHPWEFLRLLATEGHEKGVLLDGWLGKGVERPPLLHQHIHNVIGKVPNLEKLIRHGGAALGEVIGIAEELGGLEPALEALP